LMSKDPQAPSYPIFFVAPPLSNTTGIRCAPGETRTPNLLIRSAKFT
jgi:hypothetical protein